MRPFTAPADASTDAALDEDPPPWDGAAPTLRGPYEGWANWPMPNPPSLGLPNPQSYDTSTPGVVRDNVTGLEWQAQSFDDGQYGILSWGQAVAYCQGLTLAGQSDWRVPSRIEIVSLYDSTRTSPALNPVFLQPAAYSPGVGESDWTSTLAVANPSTAWTGALYWEDVGTITATSATAYTRCVRGGPATDVLPPTRYQVAAGTVYDTMTRLTWQRADSGGQLDWSDASTYCATWPPARPSCAACDDDATVHREDRVADVSRRCPSCRRSWPHKTRASPPRCDPPARPRTS